MGTRAAQPPGSLSAATRLAGLVLTAVLVLMLAVVLQRGEDAGEQQLAKRFQTRGHLAASFVSKWVEQLLADERRAAQATLRGDANLSEHFETTVKFFGFPAALMLDDRGRVLASYPRSRALLGTRIADKYAHLAAAVEGSPAISPAVDSAVLGERVVAFAVPFQSPRGRRVFSGAYHLQDTPLGPFLDAVINIVPGAEVHLVDGATGVVASSVDGRNAVPHALAAAQRLGANGDFTAEDGRSSFFSRSRVAGTPWSVIVSAPHDSLYAPVRESSALTRWLVLLVVALLAGGANVLLWHLVESRSRLRATNVALHNAARIDVLTGLPNRRHLDDALVPALSAAGRHRLPVSLLIIDIDHFKAVNDTYGHQTGDEVLCHVADLLVASMRTEDLVGRWGGEEFLAILPVTDDEGALRVAHRLRDLVSQRPYRDELTGLSVSLSVSVGSVTSHDTPDKGILLRAADEALYRAKSDGRNAVRSAHQAVAVVTPG